MTLTLYLAHVFVFNLVVDWFGWIEPAGLDVALVFAFGFWVIGITGAVMWQRRYGIGPTERDLPGRRRLIDRDGSTGSGGASESPPSHRAGADQRALLAQP